MSLMNAQCGDEQKTRRLYDASFECINMQLIEQLIKVSGLGLEQDDANIRQSKYI
jgi:hypothetical protein